MEDDDRQLAVLAELVAAQAEATRAALGGVRDELNVLSAAVRALGRRLNKMHLHVSALDAEVHRSRQPVDARGHTQKGQG